LDSASGVGNSYLQAYESPPATGDSGTKTPSTRNDSKWCATPGLVIGLCPFSRGIETPSERIRFDLTVPFRGNILLKPLRKSRQLLPGELSDGFLKLLDTHGRILSVICGKCNHLGRGGGSKNPLAPEGFFHRALDQERGDLLGAFVQGGVRFLQALDFAGGKGGLDFGHEGMDGLARLRIDGVA